MPTFTPKALLFDMDGTLVESTAAVEGAWATFGERYPHLDVPAILTTSHGVRSVDNMRKWVFPPGTPEPVLEAEADKFEVEIVNSANKAKAEGRHGIIYLLGSKDILDVAQKSGGNWAICTSATTTYASAALETVGLALPAAFVTAGDVTRGKPYPEPYLLGASKCNVDPTDCVVFEDAPSGIRSGKAAGCKVYVVSGASPSRPNQSDARLFGHIRPIIWSHTTDCLVNTPEYGLGWRGFYLAPR